MLPRKRSRWPSGRWRGTRLRASEGRGSRVTVNSARRGRRILNVTRSSSSPPQDLRREEKHAQQQGSRPSTSRSTCLFSFFFSPTGLALMSRVARPYSGVRMKPGGHQGRCGDRVIETRLGIVQPRIKLATILLWAFALPGSVDECCKRSPRTEKHAFSPLPRLAISRRGGDSPFALRQAFPGTAGARVSATFRIAVLLT